MLCFFVILLWTVVERFVAGVGASSSPAGLMEFAFGRVSETWVVPVFSMATRNITTQHLLQVRMSILEKKVPKTFSNNLNKLRKKWRLWVAAVRKISVLAPLELKLRMRDLVHEIIQSDYHWHLFKPKPVHFRTGNRADAWKVRESCPVSLSACEWEYGPAAGSFNISDTFLL